MEKSKTKWLFGNEKENWKEEGAKQWLTWLLWGVVAIQVLFIVYFNLFKTSAALDSDTAMLFTHAIEMWKNKTLFLPNWSNTTTLELDCALLFALPIYGITKNVYLSFGISNLLFLVIYISVIIGLFKKIKLSSKYMAFGLALFLMPYAFGMLDYFNMLFINGSQYGIKVILPLMMLSLLFTERERYRSKGNLILYGGYIILLLISTFSSGLYSLLCGVFPILAVAVIDFLLDGTGKKYDKYQWSVLLGSVGVSFIGYILNVTLGIMARGNNMFLTQADYFLKNLGTCVKGFFQLFHAFPTEGLNVISFEGITFLMKSALAVCLLLVFLFHCKKLFQKKEKLEISKYFMMLFLMNFIVLLFCDTRYNLENITMEYRYYMIGAVPLMFLLALQMQKWEEKWNAMTIQSIGAVLAVCLLAVTGESMYTTVNALGEHAYVQEVWEYISGLGAKSAVFVQDEETLKCIRLIDQANSKEEMKYAVYNPEEQKTDTFDYYEDVLERSYYTDNNLIVAIQGTNLAEVFPDYIANTYTYVGTTRWFDVYQSPVCRFDYVSGFPMKDRTLSIDYCYSPDYSYQGSITPQGTLSSVGDGNDTLVSPYFGPAGEDLEIIATYAVANPVEDKVGTLEVRDLSDNVVASSDIKGNQNAVTLKIKKGEVNQPQKICLKFQQGIVCEVGQIEYHVQ